VGDQASHEFCDIDGDGDYDLFVGREPTYTYQHMGDVFFYENIGDPHNPDFQYVTSNYLTMDLGSNVRQQLVDIDADGDLDLFAGVSDEIRFFRNIGDEENPSFTLEEEYYQDIHLESIVPYFCDIDADGDYDLFAGMGAIPGPPGLHLYINQGTPEQADFVLYSDNFVPGNYWVMVVPTLADIDGDGDLDLFITDSNAGDTGIWFFENTGSPHWPVFSDPELNWQGIPMESDYQRTLRFYDIDEDGDLDLFFLNDWLEPGGPNLRFYRNIGSAVSPNMQLVTLTYFPEDDIYYACPWFCDIDLDGLLDLFVGEYQGGILFFRGVDTLGITTPFQETASHEPFLFLGPNPANPVTWITYQLPYPQKAELAVYNLLGQKVAVLASGLQLPGQQTVIWNAAAYPSGVYWIRLQGKQINDVKKVVVVK